MDVNLPHVIAEVAAAFAAYERALADNDVFLINAMVWEGPRTVRFGVQEMQYGSDQIRKFHENRQQLSTRTLASKTVIATFGYDYATVNTEFACEDSELHGRKTVVWARVGPDSQPEAGLHSGWRIVASHDSVAFHRSAA